MGSASTFTHSVTPLILTFNEEANIGRVLDRLTWAPRIVILDSYSTDRTLEIVRSYPNVVVHQRPFDSFASQCNYGLSLIETEWVLSMDADYVCTPALVEELSRLEPAPDVSGFRIRFQYCIQGVALRGTLYPPRTALYRASRASYEQDGHAHRVRVDGTVSELSGFIQHDDRKPLSSWLSAQQKYARQEADKLLSVPRAELRLADRLRRTKVLAPVLAPLYTLFVKGVIFDGAAGVEYAAQRTYAELLLSLSLFDKEHQSKRA